MAAGAGPTSKQRGGVLIKAVFEALRDVDGPLPYKEVMAQVEQRVELTDADRHVYEKTGLARWQVMVHFYSIDCVKAGFIRKQRGQWSLTEEGRKIVGQSSDEIITLARRGYRKWKAAQPDARSGDDMEPGEIEESVGGPKSASVVLEDAEARAREEVERYVDAMGPYEVQDLVGALLRAMGYTTPYIAAPGKDGGTDLIAYSDPLGAKQPHVRVQVKHRDQKVSREEIAALRGIVRADREIGLFVSTGGFTSDAVKEARSGGVHIELMDLDRFLELWTAHYEKMPEEDKALLRLRPVYFLAPE